MTLSSDSPSDYIDGILAAWARERPDLDTAPAAVVARVGRLAGLLGPELGRVLRRHRLSPAAFAVLSALRRAGEPYRLSQRELMDSVLRSSGTISIRIERLTRAGLVTREPDPDDRRGVLVQLTDDGRELIDALLPDYMAAQERLLEPLGADEREALAGLLRKLLASLESTGDRDRARPTRLGVAVAPSRVARRLRRAVGLPDRDGVLVRAVQEESPAARAGLERGDLIVAAAGKEVRSIDGLHEVIDAAGAGKPLQLTVVHGVEEREVAVALEPAAP